MEANTSNLYTKYTRKVTAKLQMQKGMPPCNDSQTNSLINLQDTIVAKQNKLMELHSDEALSAFEDLVSELAFVFKKTLSKTETTVMGSIVFRTSEGRAVLFINPSEDWTPRLPAKKRSKLRTLIEKEGYEEIELVWLVESEESYPATNFPLWREICQETRVHDVSAKEWFTKFFGADEYKRLESTLDKTKAECRFVLGFETVALPTPEELSAFSSRAINRYLKEEVPAIRKRISTYCNQRGIDLPLEAIENRLLSKQRYMKLFGLTKCGESFMASEWRASINRLTESMEQTGTVAGYIKSVEQLLWEILDLFAEKDLCAKLGKDGKWLPLTKDYMEKHLKNATLGNLMHLFSHKGYKRFNREIFENPEPETWFLWEKFEAFNQSTRSEKFHKGNFFDSSTVMSIRDEVLDITFVLLGSLKLDEVQDCAFATNAKNAFFLNGLFGGMASVFDEKLDSIDTAAIAKISAIAIKNPDSHLIGLTAYMENGEYECVVYPFNPELLEENEVAGKAFHLLVNRFVRESRHNTALKGKLTMLHFYTRDGNVQIYEIADDGKRGNRPVIE